MQPGGAPSSSNSSMTRSESSASDLSDLSDLSRSSSSLSASADCIQGCSKASQKASELRETPCSRRKQVAVGKDTRGVFLFFPSQVGGHCLLGWWFSLLSPRSNLSQLALLGDASASAFTAVTRFSGSMQSICKMTSLASSVAKCFTEMLCKITTQVLQHPLRTHLLIPITRTSTWSRFVEGWPPRVNVQDSCDKQVGVRCSVSSSFLVRHH